MLTLDSSPDLTVTPAKKRPTKLLVLISAVGLVLFFSAASFLTFRDSFFSKVYDRPLALAGGEAQISSDGTCSPITGYNQSTPQDFSSAVEVADLLMASSNSLTKSAKDYKDLSLFAPRQKRDQIRNYIRQEAAARKYNLAAAMRSYPEAAKEAILSDKSRQSVASVSKNCVAMESKVTGILEFSHADFEDDSEQSVSSDDQIAIITDSGRVVLHFAELSDEMILKLDRLVNTSVSVSGFLLDDDMLVDGSQSQNILTSSAGDQSFNFVEQAHAQDSRTGDTGSGSGSDSVAGANGHMKIAVVMGSSAVSKADIEWYINTRLDNYYQQASFGKTSFEVSKIYGPYNLADSCDFKTMQDRAHTAAGISSSSYDKIIIIDSYDGCDWGGRAQAPGKVSLVKAHSFLKGTTIHEIGHTVSLKHAYYGDEEYGDIFSIMGKSASFGLPNSPQLEAIGWLGSSRIQTVSKSGTYVVYPLGDSTNNLKSLRINRSGTYPLYVEYRQPIGTDQSLPSSAFTGAILHTAFRSNSPVGAPYSQLISTSPLTIGQTYTDSISKASINVLSRNNNSLTVQVTLTGSNPTNPSPTPTRQPSPTPTRQPAPSSTNTPKPTATGTPKPTSTATPRPTATPNPTSTSTPRPTATPRPTYMPSPKPSEIRLTPIPVISSTPRPTQTPTPQPTNTPQPTQAPSTGQADLVVDDFKLVDKDGKVKTSFAVNEEIFVRVVFRNASDNAAKTNGAYTFSQIYSDKPTDAGVGSYSNINMWMRNGVFGSSYTNYYISNSFTTNNWAFPGAKSWKMTKAGNYTARVFLNSDRKATESNYANNQAVIKYTVASSGSGTVRPGSPSATPLSDGIIQPRSTAEPRVISTPNSGNVREAR